METIFFIPGMWTGKAAFPHFTNYFTEKGYRCINSVLRYHDIEPGEKPDRLLATTGIKDYVDDLEKEFRAIEGPVIILGHSMGGLLAQLLCERVSPEKLILFSSAPPLGIAALSYSVVKTYLGIFFKPFFWKRSHKLSFKRACYAILNNLGPEEQKKEYGNFVYESGKAMREIGLPQFSRQKVTKVDPDKIHCPVLVIHGREDRIVPSKTGEMIAQKYKDVATLKLIENRAHLIEIEEGWEEVADYIYSWIRA